MSNFIQLFQTNKSKSKSPFITILMLALALIFTSPTRVLAVGVVGFSSAEIGMIAGGAGVVAVGAVSALIASLSKSKNNNSQIVSIVVTPSNVTIHNGTVQQFTATGAYGDGSTHDLTNSVTWTSSNLTVATISNTAGSNGLAKALKTGSTVTTTITATDPASGIQGSATLTLNTAVLTSIEVTPPNVTVHNNTTQQFTAIGIYSDSSTQNLTNSVTWTSSNSTIATIDNTAGSNGLATIAITGSTITDNITATDPSTNIQGNTILTVNTATLSSIVVTPLGTTTIHTGTTQQFIATGVYSDNSTQDLTNSVTWSSSVPTIATISNNTGSKGLATALAIGGTTTISATFASRTGSATLTVNITATLTSITVNPSTIHSGTTWQFIATGNYDDGTTQNLTSNVTWGSSSNVIATISNAGLATALTGGAVTITATIIGGTTAGSATLTVNATATLQSIAVTPSNVTMHNGTTQQFTAIGTYNDKSTQNLTNNITWSSSNNTVATISNAPGSKGLATAGTTGTANITATDPASGIQGSTTLAVNAAATLTLITVSPSSANVPNGTTWQFTATGTYSDLSTQNITSNVTWVSNDTNIAKISNAPGSNGLATAGSSTIGSTTTITATYPGSVVTPGTATLIVSAPILASIVITPSNVTMSVNSTRQFTATGTYSDNSTQNITSNVTWASVDTTVATINPTNGLAQALKSASATNITATVGTIQGSTKLTVNAVALTSITVTPPGVSVHGSTTQQFTATGTYADNTTQDITDNVNWRSSDTNVATISNIPGSSLNGLATIIATTKVTTTITATAAGVSSSTTLTVNPATLSYITVTPSNLNMHIGTIQQFTATGTYSDGSMQDLTNNVTWGPSGSSVATISSTGLATAVAAGSVTITATINSIQGTAPLTVSAATVTLSSIAVTPTSMTIKNNTPQQFSALGRYNDGSQQDLTNNVTWRSNSAVATISDISGSKGLATAVAVGGPATITATLGTSSGSATLTVSPLTLSSITIDQASASIANKTTKQFTATGHYSDSSTQDITNSVAWATSVPNVATISNVSGSNGLATAVAEGSANITAAFTGVVSSATVLTVTGAILQSITISPTSTVSVPNRSTQQFNATGHYLDGSTQSTQDLTNSVIWKSTDTTVATFSSTTKGLATAYKAGSETTSAITATDFANSMSSSSTALTVIPAIITGNILGQVYLNDQLLAGDSPIHELVEYGYIKSIVVDNINGFIYAGDSQGSVWKCVLITGLWTRLAGPGLPTALDGSVIMALAIDLTGNIYAGTADTGGYVYKGTYSSSSDTYAWAQSATGAPNSAVNTLAINTTTNTLYAGFANGTVYSSLNSGSWTPVGGAALDGTSVNTLAINSTGNIYAGTKGTGSTGGNVYQLSGGSWTPVGTNPLSTQDGTPVNTIAIDASNNIYAGSGTNYHGKVWKYSLGIWSLLGGEASTAYPVHALVINSTTGYIYAANKNYDGAPEGHVYKYLLAGGGSWVEQYLSSNAKYALAVDSVGNTYVGTGGWGSNVYQLPTTAAAPWTILGKGSIDGQPISKLLSDCFGNIYAGTPSGGGAIYIYSPSSVHPWTKIANGYTGPFDGFASDKSGNFYYSRPFSSATLVYMYSAGRLSSLGSGLPSGLHVPLAIDTSENIYAGISSNNSGRVFKWPVGQQTTGSWTLLGTAMTETLSSLVAVTPGNIYATTITAAHTGNVYQYLPGGPWTAFGNLQAQDPNNDVNTIATDGTYVFVGTGLSNKAGNVWKIPASSLPSDSWTLLGNILAQSVMVKSIVLDSFGNIYALASLTTDSNHPGAVFTTPLSNPNWSKLVYGNGAVINSMAVRN